jgi:hypothetical protein
VSMSSSSLLPAWHLPRLSTQATLLPSSSTSSLHSLYPHTSLSSPPSLVAAASERRYTIGAAGDEYECPRCHGHKGQGPFGPCPLGSIHFTHMCELCEGRGSVAGTRSNRPQRNLGALTHRRAFGQVRRNCADCARAKEASASSESVDRSRFTSGRASSATAAVSSRPEATPARAQCEVRSSPFGPVAYSCIAHIPQIKQDIPGFLTKISSICGFGANAQSAKLVVPGLLLVRVQASRRTTTSERTALQAMWEADSDPSFLPLQPLFDLPPSPPLAPTQSSYYHSFPSSRSGLACDAGLHAVASGSSPTASAMQDVSKRPLSPACHYSDPLSCAPSPPPCLVPSTPFTFISE